MIIVKIGGGDGINLEGIIEDLSKVQEKFIIVHGANALRDKLAEALGQTKQVITSVKGYSSVYSDDKMIDLMMMSYAGIRNKRIVELCHRHGINAVGLSGLDGKAVQGVRNKGIRVYQDGKQKIVRDFSGKPESVNKALLDLLLEHGYVPVLTVPIVDEENNAINTENDDVVRVLQHCCQGGHGDQPHRSPWVPERQGRREHPDPEDLSPGAGGSRAAGGRPDEEEDARGSKAL